jgi:SAM-dependent methyltransferase
MIDDPTLRESTRWTPGLGGERVVEGIHYGWLMKDHLARYEWASPYCQGMRVLDVATGTGYGAAILRRNGASEVVAVDQEQTALAYAADRYGTDGLHWLYGDAYELGFSAEFDTVVSFETIEHLKQPEDFVLQCKRAMKPGGRFLVSTPENVGGPFVSLYHELEFSRAEFRDLLTTHFEQVELLGQRRELKLPIKVLGDFPSLYWERGMSRGHSSHRLFTAMDRLNKAPNLALAWAGGMRESWRARILPIDEPIRRSRLLEDHYYVMIGVCSSPR